MMRKKSPKNSRHSPRAALVTVGLKVNSPKLPAPVNQKVVILQKMQSGSPQDMFSAIERLAGPIEAFLFWAKVG
jgi:hypothetical protein